MLFPLLFGCLSFESQLECVFFQEAFPDPCPLAGTDGSALSLVVPCIVCWGGLSGSGGSVKLDGPEGLGLGSVDGTGIRRIGRSSTERSVTVFKGEGTASAGTGKEARSESNLYRALARSPEPGLPHAFFHLVLRLSPRGGSDYSHSVHEEAPAATE